MNDKRVRFIIFIPLICILLAASISLIYSLTRKSATEITNFEECVKAGNPVIETYPRQCITSDKKTFIEEITSTITPSGNKTNPDFYGSSTLYTCDIDSDCMVSGCNHEICQGKNEESISSVCILPEKDTPTEAGYNCKCLSYKCEWGK